MKKLLIISLLLLIVFITLSTTIIPSKNTVNKNTQANLAHPEAGYIESIGNWLIKNTRNMKKIIIVLAIVFSAGILTGCADEEVLPADGDGTIEPIGDRR